MDRKAEVRQLLRLSPDEVRQQAGDRLIVARDIEALHRRMANDIAQEIHTNNSRGRPTVLILPVGPTGQYPLLAERINTEAISLANCWFFFMDEYCGPDGNAVSADHPLSFKRAADLLFFSAVDPACGFDRTRMVFPDEHNIDQLASMMRQTGGVGTCYGGIGIHGHIAFNEPEPGVKDSPARRVDLNDYTVTINAIRAQVGGDLENFPRQAYTLGMRDLLAAQRIRLYCRNGTAFDWANTVLRLALFGTPGDDYPVTYIRDHDYVIITDEDTLTSPRHLL
jgi:glucosamine-6-phosphate deaminase